MSWVKKSSTSIGRTSLGGVIFYINKLNKILLLIKKMFMYVKYYDNK